MEDALPCIFTFSVQGYGAVHFDGQPASIKNKNGVLYVLNHPVLHHERLTNSPKCICTDLPSNWDPKTGRSALCSVERPSSSVAPLPRATLESNIILNAMKALSDKK